MQYELLISETAFHETDSAYIYYENQSAGLGKRFLESLEEAYQKLSQTPEYYSFITSGKDLRDIKIKSFPFVIIFKLTRIKFLYYGYLILTVILI